MGQYFAVFATDKPGLLELRQRHRPEHRVYLRSQGAALAVRIAGPTLDLDDGAMNGTLLVVEAESASDVEDFVRNDPYARAGLFEHVEIRGWHWGLGQPTRTGDPA